MNKSTRLLMSRADYVRQFQYFTHIQSRVILHISYSVLTLSISGVIGWKNWFKGHISRTYVRGFPFSSVLIRQFLVLQVIVTKIGEKHRKKCSKKSGKYFFHSSFIRNFHSSPLFSGRSLS